MDDCEEKREFLVYVIAIFSLKRVKGSRVQFKAMLGGTPSVHARADLACG